MAESIEAQAYLECSALTGDGVKDVLETIAKLSVLGRHSDSFCCDASSVNVQCFNCCPIC